MLRKIKRRAREELVLSVTTTHDDLNAAIKLNGKCTPDRCMHKVAIARTLFALDPDGGGTHKVRIDGGHIKFNLHGYRYKADTPRAVKRSLMFFDAEKYDVLHTQTYKVVARKTTKIIPISPERQAQINEARRKRIAKGSDEPHRSYNLRKRIEGFSGSV
jgi:hypothetical protein